MIDLNSPGTLKLLSEQMSQDVDEWCVETYQGTHRSHLGGSVIGKSCSRDLWYGFRWVQTVRFDGRMHRLFQRGHFEEPRFVSYLEGIGCDVTVFDKVLLFHPESDSYFYDNPRNIRDPLVEVVEDNPAHEYEATKRGIYLDKGKRQIQISGCDGHFGGSLYIILSLPKRYGIDQDVLFIGEYKTQGTQKFAKLQNNGVQIDKHQHYCQQSIYGYKLNIKYSVYISVNKNTDDLHLEVIKLDYVLAKELEAKAERIIFNNTPPAKISASPDYFECKWCDFRQICWFNKEAERNCRSCTRSSAVKEGQWYCDWFQSIIPKKFIRQGCGEWVSLI